MSTNYDESMAGSSRVLLWDFYDKYPQHGNDEFPAIVNQDTQHIIHAIMVAADIIRATIIEELGNVTQAIREKREGEKGEKKGDKSNFGGDE